MTGPLWPPSCARRAVTAVRAGTVSVTVGVTVATLGLGLGTLSPVATAAAKDAGADPPGAPTVHSSDGVTGPTAAPLPRLGSTRVVRSNETSYRVAPGLRFRQWDQRDRRGTIRASLLRADLQRPGLSLQYAGLPEVAARDKLTHLLADRAVAGVNGDFFDISDTGAPLGVGVAGSRVVHGPAQGWLNSFVLSAKGAGTVGQLPVRALVHTLPDLGLTNVNSPRVPSHGIGVYTERWGTAPGYSVTDGARRRDVRQVVIQGGVVVSNTVAVTTGSDIEGRVLIGRGDGAIRLNRQLPVGTRAPVKLHTDSKPEVAISGSAVLLHEGRVRTDDDGELHPRTAVGVDTDTGKVLLLVVDGRQEHSRGYTLLELARLLKQLGAEEALNLDGGGSSTMVTQRPSGRIRVANSPSDGQQREVPNGLQLVYKPR